MVELASDKTDILVTAAIVHKGQQWLPILGKLINQRKSKEGNESTSQIIVGLKSLRCANIFFL